MKRALSFVVIVLACGYADAYTGPYIIEGDDLVTLDPWYTSTAPIGSGFENVLAIEYSRDGHIYGVDWVSDTLVRFDPDTGVLETVGALGLDLLEESVDLDEDTSGQLWMLTHYGDAELFSLDRQTGAASLACEPDFPWIISLASFGGTMWTGSDLPDPPSAGCGLEHVNALVFWMDEAPDGWIHTAMSYYHASTHNVSFRRINPNTGASEPLGDYSVSGPPIFIGGITFEPYDQLPPAIPTLQWMGVVMLVLLLTAIGTFIIFRRS